LYSAYTFNNTRYVKHNTTETTRSTENHTLDILHAILFINSPSHKRESCAIARKLRNAACFSFTQGLEETTRTSSNYVDEDYPARPEIKQSLTE